MAESTVREFTQEENLDLFTDLFEDFKDVPDEVWKGGSAKTMPYSNKKMLEEMLAAFIVAEEYEKCARVKIWLDNLNSTE